MIMTNGIKPVRNKTLALVTLIVTSCTHNPKNLPTAEGLLKSTTDSFIMGNVKLREEVITKNTKIQKGLDISIDSLIERNKFVTDSLRKLNIQIQHSNKNLFERNKALRANLTKRSSLILDNMQKINDFNRKALKEQQKNLRNYHDTMAKRGVI